MKTEKITIYNLYALDKYDRTIHIGRFASYHRLQAAILANGLTKYFYETEEKPCEWGGTITLKGIEVRK